jgi:hypothetical protein
MSNTDKVIPEVAIKRTCFVICPIGEPDSPTRKRADQVYKHIIGPVAEQCGYQAFRSDQDSTPGMITAQIVKHLTTDPMVIADLSESNPNVYYELAIRHAARLPFVLLAEKGTVIPFDVHEMRVVPLDHHDMDSVEQCKIELGEHIHKAEESPADIVTPVTSADLRLRLESSADPMAEGVRAIMEELRELRADVSFLSHPHGPILSDRSFRGHGLTTAHDHPGISVLSNIESASQIGSVTSASTSFPTTVDLYRGYSIQDLARAADEAVANLPTTAGLVTDSQPNERTDAREPAAGRSDRKGSTKKEHKR